MAFIEFLPLFRDMILGISYMHKNNIVHRDLKLANIMIESSALIKIIDFGLAIKTKPNTLLKVICGTS